MPYDPGKLLLVTYPFTDQTSAKLRPALVVSGAEFNQGEDFIVVPLSSHVSGDDRFSFPILSTDTFFPATRLRVSSAVKWTKPMAISSKVVQRALGTIPPTVLKQIQSRIKSLFA